MIKNLTIAFGLIICISCQPQPDPWVNLLDKSLSKWESYLSFEYTTLDIQGPPKDSLGNLIKPLGLNYDPNGVFSMIKENGEQVLKVNGSHYGCLGSLEEFENYHLKFMVKWGQEKWAPRLDQPKDNGILYHSIGEYGVDYWNSWMLSQEMQIQEGGMGDYWSIAGSKIDIRAKINPKDSTYIYDTTGLMTTDRGNGGFAARLSGNFEKPDGEWNSMELICFGDKSIHIVNGQVVMALENSRYTRDGKDIPMTKGKLQIQTEAAETYFKAMKIRSIGEIPAEYASIFN